MFRLCLSRFKVSDVASIEGKEDSFSKLDVESGVICSGYEIHSE